MIQKTVISYNDKLKKYDLGQGHPFRGDRFINAMNFFERQGLFKLPEVTLVQPNPAVMEDLLRVHDKEYVDSIFHLAEESQMYDVETPVSPDILEGALLICGGAIQCGNTVLQDNTRLAVSLGGGHHHAGRNYGGGFCLFNDIAVLIEHLRAKYGLKRFLILDHDVHFGNGTSDIYYKDPTVLYLSLHQDPRTIYPGTGFTWQTGQGEGEGYNVNVPLPQGTGDDTYIYALNEIFVPLAEEFKPDILIANGGSDPHFADMLGNLALTWQGFFRISHLIRETADKICEGKLVIMPGSGYNSAILPMGWYALVAGAAGFPNINLEELGPPPPEEPHCRGKVEKTIDELKTLLRKKWVCFGGYSISGVQ